MSSARIRHVTKALTDYRLVVSSLVVIVVVLAALAAPWIATSDPNSLNAQNRLQGPSTDFLLGTDSFGRDLWSRLVYGARLSLTVSFTSVLIGCAVGTTIGLIAGYAGGVTSLLLMRFVDLLLAFPSILSALFIIAFIGTSVQTLIVTIGVLFIPEFARIVHSSVLSVRELDYVSAAKTVGNSDVRIAVRTILPNILAPIAVQFSLALGGAMILESSLSFLGLGPPPPASSWGRMISDASSFMRLSPYGLIWPAIAISGSVLAFNILGDVIRDRLDPRLR
jgi:peptide/nickel transport system permease protein